MGKACKRQKKRSEGNSFHRGWLEGFKGKEEINKGLKNGLIRPSTSPWASPVTLVKKRTENGDFV